MGILWNRRTPGRGLTGRPRRGYLIEFTSLEERCMPFIGSVNAVAAPKILVPANGRFVPVTVTGTINQVILDDLPGHPTAPPPALQLDAIHARNESQPIPTAFSFVTDAYRRVEPRVLLSLHRIDDATFFTPATATNPTAVVGLSRDFSYSFTIHLQAQRSDRFPYGRQYDITIAAGDEDTGGGTTIAVLVPREVIHRNGRTLIR
jgi:hypothetical protein